MISEKKFEILKKEIKKKKEEHAHIGTIMKTE